MEGEREGEERERMDTFRAACSELNVVITFVLLVAGSNHFGIAGWYSMRAMEHGLLVILLVLLTASSETLLFIEFSFFLSFFLLFLGVRFGALVRILVPILPILLLLVVLVRSCFYCCRRRSCRRYCCCSSSSYSSSSISA